MPEKILVVDDEPDIVTVLSKILEYAGYAVIKAYNGSEALELARSEGPELVLLDYMMPDATGLDVLRGIKTFSEDTYVIMVTGRGSEEVAATVMKAGASDYVIKPFVKDQILSCVRDTLKVRQAEITARRLQSELQELNQELERKVEERTNDLMETQDRLIHQQNLASLGEMSGGMAHEIRNPLNSIALYAQILAEELPADDKKRDYLSRIMNDVDRINAIVTNLNLFSRRTKREKTPTHIQKPLETAIKTLSTRFTAQGIKISVQMEKDLPEVLASPEEMEEVFSHLLINSIHAMPQGGEITVSVRLVSGSHRPELGRSSIQSRDYLEISIQDTGVGIPKEEQNRIFIPFYTTKTDWEGTGLGLSVVHNVVSDHEGTIDVESDVGKGARFTIRLPALQSGSQFAAGQKLATG